jgi:hypothetical protein
MITASSRLGDQATRFGSAASTLQTDSTFAAAAAISAAIVVLVRRKLIEIP